MSLPDLHVRPVTPEPWPDLVDLFERPGPRGSWPRTAACYCAFWRVPPADYERGFRARSRHKQTGGPNKEYMEGVVASGVVPGLLAYRGGQAVGWVAVSAREELVRLEHSPDLRLADEPPGEAVWSIACFYIHRAHWRTGVAATLLDAAVERALAHGAEAVEGYPVQVGNVDPYTGYDGMFAKAGFHQARAGRGLGRSLWRRRLGPSGES
jgi:GNAT superfamily N-acetyltransferase